MSSQVTPSASVVNVRSVTAGSSRYSANRSTPRSPATMIIPGVPGSTSAWVDGSTRRTRRPGSGSPISSWLGGSPRSAVTTVVVSVIP